MQITSDVTLKGPVWAEMLDRLVEEVFATNWDVYALCISIGMMYDGQIDSDDMAPQDYTENPRYIPRNVLINGERKGLLEFMLQAALITTKHVDLSEEKRLEYAFNDNAEIPFKPLQFLTNFANYGITKLKDALGDASDVEMLERIMTFLSDTYENGYDPTSGLDLDLDDFV